MRVHGWCVTICMLAACAPVPRSVDSASTARPEARFGHRMVYHAARRTTLLYGGQTSDKRTLGDFWEWNGARWTRLNANGPAPRSWAGLSYDHARDRIVLFGGRSADGAARDDVWEWDGQRWHEQSARGPAARDHHAQTYDLARRRTVIHGGFTGGAVLGDLWEWDGRTWRKVDTPGPAPRAAHSLAYAPSLGSIVMFGGLDLSGAAFGDTWLWQGQRWLSTLTLASGRTHLASAFSSQERCVLRFGGKDRARTPSPELHCLRNGTWDRLSNGGPSARIDAAMVYDEARNVLILFGGKLPDPDGRSFGDTWEWADGRWRIRSPA